MTTQLGTASLAASSSISAAAKVRAKAASSLAGFGSVVGTLGLMVRLPSAATTGGFAGITVDPTPYIYTATQAIIAAILDASNGSSRARAQIVIAASPYVSIYAVAGSAFVLRTGGSRSQLTGQYFATLFTPGGMSQTFAVSLWSAIANYLFKNSTALLHADGLTAATAVSGNGIDLIDLSL